jgi:hypothetical protein
LPAPRQKVQQLAAPAWSPSCPSSPPSRTRCFSGPLPQTTKLLVFQIPDRPASWCVVLLPGFFLLISGPANTRGSLHSAPHRSSRRARHRKRERMPVSPPLSAPSPSATW